MLEKNINMDRLTEQLLRKYPIFGSVLSDVKLKYTSKISTAATDGKSIYMNKKFMSSLSEDEQLFVLAHEACHIALKHLDRAKERDGFAWNYATDAIINEHLAKDGIQPLKGAIRKDDALKYNAEELYDIIYQKRQQNQQQSGGGENLQNPQSPNKNQQQNSQQNQQNQSGQSVQQQQANQAQQPQQGQQGQGACQQGQSSQQKTQQNGQNGQGGQSGSDSQQSNAQQDKQQEQKNGSKGAGGFGGSQNSNNGGGSGGGLGGKNQTQTSNQQNGSGMTGNGGANWDDKNAPPTDAENPDSQNGQNNQNSQQNGQNGQQQQNGQQNQQEQQGQNGQQNNQSDDPNEQNQQQNSQNDAENGNNKQDYKQSNLDKKQQNNDKNNQQNQSDDELGNQNQNQNSNMQNNLQSSSSGNQNPVDDIHPYGEQDYEDDEDIDKQGNDGKDGENVENNQNGQNGQWGQDYRNSDMINNTKSEKKDKSDEDSQNNSDLNNGNNSQQSQDYRNSDMINNSKSENSGKNGDMQTNTELANPEDINNIGHDDHSLWQKAKEKKADKTKQNGNKDKDGKDSSKTFDDEEMSEVDFFKKNEELKAKEAQEIMERVRSQERGFGGGGEFSLNDIGEKDKAVTDWRKLLKTYIDKEEERWGHRFSDSGNNWAARIEDYEVDERAETEIILDTSGSVSPELLRAFLRQTKTILKDSDIKVGMFSDSFYGWQEVKKAADIDKLRFYGGGGTNFDAASMAFSKKKTVNRICLTDGEDGGNAGIREKRKDIIWICYGNPNFKPDYGKVIYVAPEDIAEKVKKNSGRTY